MRTSRKLGIAALAILGITFFAAARVNVAPSVSLASPLDGASFPKGSVVTLAADATDPDSAITRVEWYADGVRVGFDSMAPYSASWTAPAGTHAVKAIAIDRWNARGTSATASIVVTAQASVRDTIAPGVPAGLNSTARNASSITLRWSASTDNIGGSGIAAYDVYRGSTLAGSTSTTGFTDSNLLASTGYTYTVRARDVAGNASARSAALVTATTGAVSRAALWHRVNGYFTQWGIYNPGYLVRNLQTSGNASRLTHLTYAFGNVRNNRCEVGVLKSTDANTGEGGDAYADYSRAFTAAESVDGVADVTGAPLRGNWNQLRKLKAKYPHLKVLMSLGGWTWSRGFASAARPENRQAFVASCIDAYIRGNLPAFDRAGGAGSAAGVFDGIDIDWEFPATCGLTCGTAEDTDNYTALLAEFRRQLDAVRPGLELTVAVGAGVDKIRVTRPELYQQYVDAINVMSYDFHGGWESRTNFHSGLFNSTNDPSTGDSRYYDTNDAIQAFLSRGVAASKLNVGIASYGRGWTGVGATNNGLFQPGSPAPGSVEPGVERYAVLRALAWPAYADASSKARWIYNGSTFWSFDDPITIADKTAYVRVQGLGGAFLWDFSGDDAQSSLMGSISSGLL